MAKLATTYLEYAGFAMDHRRLRFAQRRHFLWHHRWLMLGFGAAAISTGDDTATPVVNLLQLVKHEVSHHLIQMLRHRWQEAARWSRPIDFPSL